MITITDIARSRLIDTLKSENSTLLRFGLEGGGCSGLRYYFSIESEKSADDIEITIEGDFTLLVDSVSAMYLDNAEIDFKKDLLGESFVFNNPNATTKCGCGQSTAFG